MVDTETQLAGLGWRWADLGRRLRVHPNTLTAWRRDGPPEYVKEYLRAMLLIKEALG